MTRTPALRSISRRLIVSVLLAELIFALAMTLLAIGYERHEHFHALGIALMGRTDSLLGAVQDAEDPGDHVMLDRTGLQLPPEDIYEVRDSDGHLLGRSPNWSGPGSNAAEWSGDGFYNTRINDHGYRILVRHGLRVVDPGHSDGGTPRHVVIYYGARVGPVWHAIRQAVLFFSLSNLALLVGTGWLMMWLLQRGLAPLRELAARAETISMHRASFQPPQAALRTRELAPLAIALAAAVERLQASYALQQRFTGDAAHELKTAVAVVKSSLQLLNLRPRTAEEYRSGLEVTLEDCQRMEDIVLRMLLLARAESAAADDTLSASADLTACAEATVRQFQAFATVRNVALVFTSAGAASVPITAEEGALLCSNLILNALQHSAVGTEVRVRIEPSSRSIVLLVEDHGDGITPELLPHVFERFSRGDPSRSRHTGGTGLGLAICKAIVDRAGGTIRLQSVLNQGTIARVQLPCAPMANAPMQTTPLELEKVPSA